MHSQVSQVEEFRSRKFGSRMYWINMQQCLIRKVPMCKESRGNSNEDEVSASQIREANPVTAKVFFLTDANCSSACLDFADDILRIPGVIHVGQTTSVDTDYMDTRFFDLKSGLASVCTPMKVYRNRTRKSNHWYEPQYQWTESIRDTKSIESWVKYLAFANVGHVKEKGKKDEPNIRIFPYK